MEMEIDPLPSPSPTSTTSHNAEKDNKKQDSVEDNENEEYCICRKEDDGRFMIQCDSCEEWFHGHCVGLSKKEGNELNEYKCPICSGISIDSLKSINIFPCFPDF